MFFFLQTKTSQAANHQSNAMHGQYTDNKITDENLNLNQMQPKVNLLRKEAVGGLGSGLSPTTGGGTGGSGNANIVSSIPLHRRELLAQKLEQIKQQKWTSLQELSWSQFLIGEQ